MNRIYKVIGNTMTQSQVVVSELAKGFNQLSSSTSLNISLNKKQFKFKFTTAASLFFITFPSHAYIDIQQTANGTIQNSNVNNSQTDPIYNGKEGSRPYNYWNPGNKSYTDKGQKNTSTEGLNGKKAEDYFYPQTAQGIKLGRETNIQSTADKSNPQYDGIAIGDYSKATGGVAVALGAFAKAEKTGAVAVGTAALADGFNSLSMMRQSSAEGDYATAIGSVAWAKGHASFALGASATALSDQSIAIGSVSPQTLEGDRQNPNGAKKTKYDGMNRTQTNGKHSIAMGSGAKTNGDNSFAFGSNAETGQFTKSNDEYLNTDVMKADDQNTAVGAIAFGVESKAKKEKTIALGYKAEAHSKKAVAVGTEAKALQDRSTTLGTSAQSKAKNATALGFAAQAKHKNSVALGASSVTAEKVATEKTTMNGNEHTFAGGKPIGTVSIGAKNQERTLTNLAAGRISKESTDGINGSQLHAVKEEVEKGWMLKVAQNGGKVISQNGPKKVKLGDTVTIKAGKNIKIKQKDTNITIATRDHLQIHTLTAGGKNGQKDIDGTISAKGKDGQSGVTLNGKDGSIEMTSPNKANGRATKVTVSVHKGSKGLNGQDGAQKARLIYERPNGKQEEVATLNDGLMFAGNDGQNGNYEKVVRRKLNQKLNILGGISDKAKLSNSNFVTSANLGVRYKDDESLEIVMKKRPKFAGIVLNGKDGKAAKIQFKDKDGQDGMAIMAKSGNDGKQSLVLHANGKEGVTFDADGRITNLMDGKDGKDAVNLSQLEKAKEELTKKGFGIQAADGKSVKKPLGQNVEIVGANKNITTKVHGGKVKIALAKTIDLSKDGSVKTGSTTVNNNGVKVGRTVALTQEGLKVNAKIALNKTGLKVGDVKISQQGIAAGNKKITGVKEGDISPTSKEAINGGQLFTEVAKAKTEVEAGTNIAYVEERKGENQQSIYKIHADGTSVSAGSASLSVVKGNKDQHYVTDYKIDLAETTKADIAKGVEAKTQVDKGIYLAGDEGAATNHQLGERIQITGDENIHTVTTAQGIAVKLNRQLEVDSVQANKFTAGNVIISAKDGINAGNTQITGVTSGLIDKAGQSVGIHQATGEMLQNAANVGDLKQVAGDIYYQLDGVSHRVNRLEKQVRAVGASSAAAASLPQVYHAGKSMLSAAAGGYNGASALAIGYSRTSDNGKLLLKLTGTANSTGQYAGGVGFGYQW